MANVPTPKANWILRILLTIFSVSLGVWISISVLHVFRITPDQIKLVNFDEEVAKASDFVMQDVGQFFQMGVLVLGSLWALAIVDKDQRLKLADRPELVMFVIGTGLFVLSLYFLQQYGDIVKWAVWDGRSLTGEAGQKLFPDILESPYFRLHYQVAVRCFYSGLVVSGLTAFSLCRLR
jgi:hypothetical protein